LVKFLTLHKPTNLPTIEKSQSVQNALRQLNGGSTVTLGRFSLARRRMVEEGAASPWAPAHVSRLLA
jgi:hypothetical protein